MMDFRKVPLVQLVLAGASTFILLVALITLGVRGGGGHARPGTALPTPSVSASAPASVSPTSGAVSPPLGVAAKPKLLHALKAGAASPPKVGTSVSGLLAASALGTGVTADVVDVLTGQPLFAVGATTPAPPASTAKLFTAAAALHVLGPDATLTTSVVNGATAGQIVLVGGGDPTLAGTVPDPAGTYPASASLAGLAQATAKKLYGQTVTVAYDTSLYTGVTAAPGWKPTYFTEGNVAPVSALEVDEGRLVALSTAPRSTNPPVEAAHEFAALLVHDGLKVTGSVTPGVGGAGVKPIAKVSSAPVSALVERMLRLSDNDLAESLARQVAIKLHQPATFAGAAAAVAQAVGQLGIDASTIHMVDGSGLSISDTTQAATLVALVRAAGLPAHPELRSLLSGLPVAGFLGTLAIRYATPQTAVGVGAVRAKTGTLTHVSALAGVVVDADGRQLAFALIAGQVPSDSPDDAEAALDRVAATLAGCGCR